MTEQFSACILQCSNLRKKVPSHSLHYAPHLCVNITMEFMRWQSQVRRKGVKY